MEVLEGNQEDPQWSVCWVSNSGRLPPPELLTFAAARRGGVRRAPAGREPRPTVMEPRPQAQGGTTTEHRQRKTTTLAPSHRLCRRPWNSPPPPPPHLVELGRNFLHVFFFFFSFM